MTTAALAEGEQRQIADLRSQREELAHGAAEVAKQVDALIADDESLIAALEELDGYIGLQLARMDAAEKSIVAAEAEVAAAQVEADWLTGEIETIRERLRQRAIEVFVRPPTGVVEQLSSGDLNENAVRLFLIDLAIGNELEITDELRTAEAQLDVGATARRRTGPGGRTRAGRPTGAPLRVGGGAGRSRGVSGRGSATDR